MTGFYTLTNKQLKELSDKEFLIHILEQKKSQLTNYNGDNSKFASPMFKRIRATIKRLKANKGLGEFGYNNINWK